MRVEQTGPVVKDAKDRTDAADLGLDLSGGDDATLFRWLVACLLFGARISQDRAAAAFAELDGDGVLTPQGLAEASDAHLVALLDAGRYTRFDDSKAAELRRLGRDVLDRYDGRLSALPEGAQDDQGGVGAAAGVHGHRTGRRRHLPARRPGGLAPLSRRRRGRQPTKTASGRAPSGPGR